MAILSLVSVLIIAGMALHQFPLKKAIHALLIPRLDRHTPVMVVVENKY
jgi:hypothetical protein